MLALVRGEPGTESGADGPHFGSLLATPDGARELPLHVMGEHAFGDAG